MRKGRPAFTDCELHVGILCDHRGCCETCGWNPEVEKHRMREIREKRKYNFFVRRSFVPGENKNFIKGRIM